MRPSISWPGAPMALVSAALFGASTPLAKLLLGDGVDPWLLAGLLYLGSGAGLGLIHITRNLFGNPAAEAPLRRGDMPWLALVVVTGGMIGPLLLMFIAEVMFDLREKSPVYWFFIASPMMSVAMNEFNAFGQMYREPWLAVALNAAYYGAWWIGLRVWCLRRAPVWLGRTCETVVAEEAAPQT